MSDFPSWFKGLTGFDPRAWQRSLGEDAVPRSRLIRIPTGYGKTLGVLGAWLFHRVVRNDPAWPRRLVWTLPMRVLTTQTEGEVRKLVEGIGKLWDPERDHAGKIGVHVLMGGVTADREWNLYPEEPAVFVGTQDMLLSRALNRGYAAGRARWPMEFGLLNHDALWVLDEVQLMDVGLATTAQLQAYFDEDTPRGTRPRLSWWMSATLQPDWLRSVDTQPRHEEWVSEPVVLEPQARRSGLAAIKKELALVDVPASKARDFASRCAEEHQALEDGEFGRITLVVCNTVKRANETYDALSKLGVAKQLELVHSRFRANERDAWKARFLERKTCAPGVDRIIVATQVVEAGVDISAGCLVTELAPWSSLVQRLGRCARYGGTGKVVVVDRGRDDKDVAPYSSEQLEGALKALRSITMDSGDVGIATLEAFEEELTAKRRADLYPYRPAHLLLRRELDELFDTTPDLTGADVDISRFIRSGVERDLSVFWLDVPAKAPKGEPPPVPPPRYRPLRQELCSVPFLAAQDWLCGEKTTSDKKPRLRKGVRAWLWDWIDGQWVVAVRAALTPGKVVCVASDVGGYRLDRGFDPEAEDPVPPVGTPDELRPEVDAEVADDLEDAEDASISPPRARAPYRTIATHNGEVGELARKLAAAVGLHARKADLLGLAGRWHDLGKAHAAFQGSIKAVDARPARQDLAKAPDGGWARPMYRISPQEIRPGFRHELASCLALFAVLRRYDSRHPGLLGDFAEVLALVGDAPPSAPEADRATATPIEREILACSAEEFDLLAYLVLCHHGKVRVSLHAGPKDQEYRSRDDRGLPIRGVREGDVLPATPLDSGALLPAFTLSLGPASLGLSSTTGRSWRERTLALQRAHGPAHLAWLEAVLIAADRRASKLTTEDPLLDPKTGGGA